MKVSELIKKLSKFDGDTEVVVWEDGREYGDFSVLSPDDEDNHVTIMI